MPLLLLCPVRRLWSGCLLLSILAFILFNVSLTTTVLSVQPPAKHSWLAHQLALRLRVEHQCSVTSRTSHPVGHPDIYKSALPQCAAQVWTSQMVQPQSRETVTCIVLSIFLLFKSMPNRNHRLSP